MTLKRERGCVPAFLFYMKGSEIMTDEDIRKKVLTQINNACTKEIGEDQQIG